MRLKFRSFQFSPLGVKGDDDDQVDVAKKDQVEGLRENERKTVAYEIPNTAFQIPSHQYG